jgi:hypothetical protein
MKNSLKRILLKTWPKFAVALVGVLIYLFAIRLSEDIKGLLVNIAVRGFQDVTNLCGRP